MQRSLLIEDLVSCCDDDRVSDLLADCHIFDGLMGPTYKFWFMCALQEERRRLAEGERRDVRDLSI